MTGTRTMGAAAAAAVVLSAAPVWAQGPPYAFTKVQVAGAVQTEPTGINDSGVVAGTSWSSDGTIHAFTYKSGTFTSMDFPAAPYNWGFGINNAGQLVGSYGFGPHGPWFGLITDGTTTTSYQYLGQQTDGRAINSSGQIVGEWDNGGPPERGYLKSGDTYIGLDMPGALQTYVLGINDASSMTGSFLASDGRLHGFAYAGGTFKQIDALGAGQTFIGGLNNANAMVGYSQNGTITHGFVMSGSRFRAFDVDFPGALMTKPWAINNNGQIVGSYTSPTCALCGFIATPRTDVPPACDQTLTLGYSTGTLRLNFANFQASTPLTWSMWLLALNTAVPLWSTSVSSIAPTSFQIPLAVPSIGSVVAVSLLSGSDGSPVCVDYASVNTNGTTP
ncbi:MAG TPA: hypothetical protein VFB07_12090 [Vicinamibacterales bacterium]|nr:hypothetical protein [Vicinamibacterales bacterium]